MGESDAGVKVLALDFGAARTGVAVSDLTGTIARPLGVVERAAERGLDEVVALIREHEPERVVVGMPLTLRGEQGEQARRTQEFVEELRTRVGVSVETYDERFTTALAERGGGADAEAAAHLLSSYLEWSSASR